MALSTIGMCIYTDVSIKKHNQIVMKPSDFVKPR